MTKVRLLMAAVGGRRGSRCKLQRSGVRTGSSAPTTIYACIKAGQLIKNKEVAVPSCGGKTAVQIDGYPENANGLPQCTGIPSLRD